MGEETTHSCQEAGITGNHLGGWFTAEKPAPAPMRLILLSGLLLSIISWESSLILLLHIQSIRKLDQLHLQTLLWIPFLTPSRAPTLISAHIDCSKLTGNPVSTPATKASSPASRESSSCHCPLLSNLQWLPLPSATASILAVVCMICPSPLLSLSFQTASSLHQESLQAVPQACVCLRILRVLCPLPGLPLPPTVTGLAPALQPGFCSCYTSHKGLPWPSHARWHLFILNPLVLLYFSSYHLLLLDHILYIYWFSCLSSVSFSRMSTPGQQKYHPLWLLLDLPTAPEMVPST